MDKVLIIITLLSCSLYAMGPGSIPLEGGKLAPHSRCRIQSQDSEDIKTRVFSLCKKCKDFNICVKGIIVKRTGINQCIGKLHETYKNAINIQKNCHEESRPSDQKKNQPAVNMYEGVSLEKWCADKKEQLSLERLVTDLEQRHSWASSELEILELEIQSKKSVIEGYRKQVIELQRELEKTKETGKMSDDLYRGLYLNLCEYDGYCQEAAEGIDVILKDVDKDKKSLSDLKLNMEKNLPRCGGK